MKAKGTREFQKIEEREKRKGQRREFQILKGREKNFRNIRLSDKISETEGHDTRFLK